MVHVGRAAARRLPRPRRHRRRRSLLRSRASPERRPRRAARRRPSRSSRHGQVRIKPPGATPGPEKAARAERHTLVAGPTRHDKALDKRNTQAAGSPNGDPRNDPKNDPKKSDEYSLDRQSQGGYSAAVVGTVVGGRYFVRRLCGEGGMGRVYEAEHTDIGKRVALKILHPAYSQTPDLVERLRREARASSKISHPNLVDVTDSGTTPDGALFYVMEYLEGIELGELIFKEGKLGLALRSPAHRRTDLPRALQAAHQVNVIHRDLKPENVLILSRDGQKDFVKVLDFGIAKSGTDVDDDDKQADGKPSRRLTHPGMTMGTPEYMAPEQAAGRPADPRSDVYAAGGLLYEMLSGKPPYEGSNFMEILHKKATMLPAPLSTLREDIPTSLDQLITRTLAKDPATRPQSMEELGRALLEVGGLAYPSIGKIDLAFFASAESGGTPNASGPHTHPPPVTQSTSALTRLRGIERKKIYIAAGGLTGLLIALVIGGRFPGKHKPKPIEPVAVAVAAPLPAQIVAPPPAPPPVIEPPPAPPEPVAAEEGTDEDEAAEPEQAAPTRHGGRGRRGPVAPSPAQSKKMLKEGERLLHLEKFNEARGVFQKLTQSKHDRGPALVGLAEISFQEKRYAEAVKSAQLAAGNGGGVRARVLQGDAHFRLNHFKEAAKAYQDALKLDPANPSAKSGLALANKRM